MKALTTSLVAVLCAVLSADVIAGEVASKRWKPHSIGTARRRINRLRLRCFRFRKCKNLLHLTVGGVF